MRVEARLIDGPRGGELFATNGFRYNLVFERAGNNFWDFDPEKALEPVETERIHYEADHVIVYYRVAS